MKQKLFSLVILTLLLHCGCFAHDAMDNCSTNPTNVSIVIMGRSGSGVSTTVKKLLGPQVATEEIGSRGSLITEYTISSPDEPEKFIKFIDVDGLVDGRVESGDAQVLSALKSYIRNPDGLGGYYPNFFLIISNFDDNRFQGKKSFFTQVLSRVELFQKKLCGRSTKNTAILLTKLMRVTLQNRRLPKHKITEFRNTLKEFTSFSDQLHFVVGENLAVENGLSIENGYTKLPNREEYPKNVFSKLADTAEKLNDTLGTNVLKHFRDNRGQYTQITTNFFQEADERDSNEFLLAINRVDSDIQESEINLELQKTYESFDDSFKNAAISSLVALQLHFQKNNLTMISQLPQTSLEKVKFFQNLEIDGNKLSLLSRTFELNMPEYIQNPVVGLGFDVTKDETLTTSPFTQNNYLPSRLGYSLPAFLACSLLPSESQVDYTFFSENFQQYIPLRMKYLDFAYGENFTFSGQSKAGFNIRPDESENIVSLTAAREVRVWKCEINQNSEFDKDFVDTVNSLTRFDEGDRESVKSWDIFFGKYGTHVVTKAYGGGYMAGLIAVPRNSEILENPDKIKETLQKINDFDRLAISEKPIFSIYGGYRDSRLEHGYNLDENVREGLLNTWRSSLKCDPAILTYELKLTPISKFAGKINENIQQEVDRSISLLLEGKLIFKQSRKNNKTKTRNTTNRPNIRTPIVADNPSNETNTETVEHTTEFQPEIPTSTTTLEFIPTTTPATHSASNYFENSQNFNPPAKSTESPKICRNKQRRIEEDYAENVVGQSFHVLRDIILPTSPFDLVGRDSRGNKINRLLIKDSSSTPCTVVNLEEFETTDDYITQRISKFDTQLYLVTRKVPPGYTGKIRPGNYIKNINSVSREFQFEVEHRNGNFKLVSDYRRNISSDFVYAVKSLRPFHKNNCESKTEYRDFFDKFGTHYVESAPSGWSFVVTLNDISLEKGKEILGPNFNTCTSKNMFMVDKIKNIRLADRALKHNMILQTLGSSLSLQYSDKKMDVDYAYFILVTEGLNCNI